MSRLHLFVGPSIFGVDLSSSALAAVKIHGPIQHGDLRRLSARQEPGVVAVADGLFHQHLPIGHREIRDVLANGWTVWGLSSMGAIRAAEMGSLGMRGFGEVFRRFATPPGLDDDEVALLHTDGPPYAPLTEPLIHLREALDTIVRDDVIDPITRERAVARLKSAWYGHRSTRFFAEVLATDAGPGAARKAMEALSQSRLKGKDVSDFLRVRPWSAG